MSTDPSSIPRLDGLETGALIHDIGKINVPSDFLSRPGHLSDAASRIVMAHPEVGHEIVAGLAVIREHEFDAPGPAALINPLF